MNEPLPANRLREAYARVEADGLEDLERVAREAETVGRQAVLAALGPPTAPPIENKAEAEAERQRVLDETLRDASWAMEQHRDRLGRRVTSTHDAKVMRQIYESLRSMAGADGGADADPSFQ